MEQAMWFKILYELNASQREVAVNSLSHEAQTRLRCLRLWGSHLDPSTQVQTNLLNDKQTLGLHAWQA